jgi:hypothetical protein
MADSQRARYSYLNSEAEPAYSAGYALGASYRRGKYFYWEIGANYNGTVVGFENVLDGKNAGVQATQLSGNHRAQYTWPGPGVCWVFGHLAEWFQE